MCLFFICVCVCVSVCRYIVLYLCVGVSVLKCCTVFYVSGCVGMYKFALYLCIL